MGYFKWPFLDKMNIKSTLSNTFLNLPGWHTRRKLVVIESDDWGSIRMPSREVKQKLQQAEQRVQILLDSDNDAPLTPFTPEAE